MRRMLTETDVAYLEKAQKAMSFDESGNTEVLKDLKADGKITISDATKLVDALGNELLKQSSNVILIDKPEDAVDHINEPGVFGMKYYRESRYSYLIGTINRRSGDYLWLDGLLVRIYYTNTGDRNFYAGLMEDKSCQFVNSGFYLEFSKPLAISTDLDKYNHCITLKDSTGNILFTAMMRNKKNTVCDSYSTLHTMFGNGVYAGNGTYAQLDLTGGTAAKDKLIKLDGTEATLDTLGTITYADKAFLSR